MADLPEVFLSTAQLSGVVSRGVRTGTIKRLEGRLYTTNVAEPAESVVRRNLWQIVGLLFPDAVVSHRTALEGRPTPGGSIFLTGPYARIVRLPGLRIRQIPGPGPLEGDNRFIQSLWLASPARAMVECLRTRRVRGLESPSLPRAEIEDRLDRLIRFSGEDEANALRDRAIAIAPELEAEEAAAELRALVGTLLGTRNAELETGAGLARAIGEPYDSARVELFNTLLAELLAWQPRLRYDDHLQGRPFENLAFVDAYFSNFIEGTEFEVQEAVAIVFENRIPRARPEDAHDILGTYRIVSNPREMGRSAVYPGSHFDGFLATLRRHHATLMGGRPDKRPGEFKLEVNRAGLTVFVEPALVRGTLKQGWDMLRSIPDPFRRAALMMFIVSEVHPFDDGNGRLARVMMNAELIAGRQRRIFIPTSYRDDYLLALRALSRQREPEPLLKMLEFAQAFSDAIDFTDLQGALEVLRRSNAFERDPTARLRMPAAA
ncbi:MAG TPA: Fic family protein [Longimicrobium sp.]|nr:Fic family protein [Longimicrobium sp.]